MQITRFLLVAIAALTLLGCERAEPQSKLGAGYEGGLVEHQQPPPKLQDTIEVPQATGVVDATDTDTRAQDPAVPAPVALPDIPSATEAELETDYPTDDDDWVVPTPLPSNLANAGDEQPLIEDVDDGQQAPTPESQSENRIPGDSSASLPSENAGGTKVDTHADAEPAVIAEDGLIAQAKLPRDRPLLDWPLHLLSLEGIEGIGAGAIAIFRTPTGDEVRAGVGDLVGDIAAKVVSIQSDRVLLTWIEIDERGTPRMVHSKFLLGN